MSCRATPTIPSPGACAANRIETMIITIAIISADKDKAAAQWPNKRRERVMARKPTRLAGITIPICTPHVARAFLSGLLIVALLGIGHQAEARIIKLVIQTRTSPAFGGASFGNVGQYEQLTGVAYGEVNPKDPLNAVITDIELAPRNSRGMVEYSMDFAITKPIDMKRGNGTLLYDVPNRGNIRSPELNVGGNATNIGDGFLEREGYTLVDNGWEGDVTTGLQIRLPIARHRDGSEIKGRVRAEYIFGSPASTIDVTEPPAYEAVNTDNAGATLTRRGGENNPPGKNPKIEGGVRRLCPVALPRVPGPKERR